MLEGRSRYIIKMAMDQLNLLAPQNFLCLYEVVANLKVAHYSGNQKVSFRNISFTISPEE